MKAKMHLSRVIGVATALQAPPLFHGSWLMFGFDDDTYNVIQDLYSESGIAWGYLLCATAVLWSARRAWRGKPIAALVVSAWLTSVATVIALDSASSHVRNGESPQVAALYADSAETLFFLVPGVVVIVAGLALAAHNLRHKFAAKAVDSGQNHKQPQ